MIQYPLHGSYSPSQLKMVGAFKTVTSGNPTVLRDGTKVASDKKMFTVVRESAGLYTVTFNDNVRVPVLPFIDADLHQAVTPTVKAKVHVVNDSWDASEKSFQVKILKDSDASAVDGDAGDTVVFKIDGAIDSVGVDPA